MDDQEALVTEVGFTPEEAADATSGDIDRNGSAAILDGLINALKDSGAQSYDDDELLESGVDTAAGHGSDKHRPGLVLTALELLERVRRAEARALAHDTVKAHARTLEVLIFDLEQAGVAPFSDDDVVAMLSGNDRSGRTALTLASLLARVLDAEGARTTAELAASKWFLLGTHLSEHGVDIDSPGVDAPGVVMELLASTLWARKHVPPSSAHPVKDGFYRCRFDSGCGHSESRWAILEVLDGRVLWPGLPGGTPIDDPRITWGGRVEAENDASGLGDRTQG